MAEPSVPTLKSCLGHVAHKEAYIAARNREIETGEYMIDEATTRKWLAWAEGELKSWQAALQRAIDEDKPKTSLA